MRCLSEKSRKADHAVAIQFSYWGQLSLGRCVEERLHDTDHLVRKWKALMIFHHSSERHVKCQSKCGTCWVFINLSDFILILKSWLSVQACILKITFLLTTFALNRCSPVLCTKFPFCCNRWKGLAVKYTLENLPHQLKRRGSEKSEEYVFSSGSGT